MATNKRKVSKRSKLLNIESLCVDYITPAGSVRAVNNITLDIAVGETLGLAGESGCGKSTLAFAISRLHKAPALISDGKIVFEGNDILSMSDEELRALRWKEISIVFQSAMNSLNPVITIGEQVMDVLAAHLTISNAQAYDRAAELMEFVGIHADRLKSYPHQLSGGMRQRIAIAIALALEPKLIIMDEPTTALDVVVEREIMDELQELKLKFGFSILLISHDLSLMGEITDRIGIMYAGKLIELGKTRQIMSHPLHPYTKGLLNSFPKIGDSGKRLKGIPGNPLNLLEKHEGCYFHPRCSYAQSGCQSIDPEVSYLNGREFKCHYPLVEEVIEEGVR